MPELQPTLPIADTFRSAYLEQYRMLPLAIEDGHLRVAIAGEPNEDALADLEHLFGSPVLAVPVDHTLLIDAIHRVFAAQESVVELVKDLDTPADIQEGEDGTRDARIQAAQPFVVRYVNLLIRDAHQSGASDVHLEATREGLRVRLRIDGVLGEVPSPPRQYHTAVVSRIKLIAELDIAERRVPQDGRVRLRLESRELDIRISTTPTLFGESVVLRLLDQGGRPVTLDELGMPADILQRFALLCRRAHGIVLTTGPTGSGKTTTLYAALGLRNPVEEKIITVEDPVEYHVPGVTQVPVHAKAGVTFPAALRSILRQDPDIMMVGETRDAETAAIAVQAAMTGHLVFSTLHTNDAVSAITRLIDLRVEPHMVAASVEAVLAQRLVRRNCPECRESYRPDSQVVALLSHGPVPADTASLRLQRGRGCDHCRHTGFRGRTGVYELLVICDRLRDVLVHDLNLNRLREVAVQEGFTPLLNDGWAKIQGGVTTVEEVLRVAGQ